MISEHSETGFEPVDELITKINNIIKQWNSLAQPVTENLRTCVQDARFEAELDVKIEHVMLGLMLVLAREDSEYSLEHVTIMEAQPFLQFGNFETVSQSVHAQIFVALPLCLQAYDNAVS